MNAYQRNRWWIVRTLQLPVDLFVFATLAFFLVRLLPGDPVQNAAAASGEPMTEEQIEQLRIAMGLGGTLFEQLMNFWGGLFRLDLGTSLASGVAVTDEVFTRLPATLELVMVGLFSCIAFTGVLGFVYLRTRSSRVRSVIRGYASTADGIPVFVVAIIGIVLFYVLLHWAPPPLGRTAGGALPMITGFPLLDELLSGNLVMFGETIVRYILPVGAVMITNTPNLLVQLLGGLDAEVAQNTTRFQVASGASRRSIYASVFRRSATSVVVVFGMMFGGMLGGAVALERLFGFGGLGQLAIRAVDHVDFPLLQGFLVLIVGFCLIIYFLVDFVNMLLDPRRRPGVMVEA